MAYLIGQYNKKIGSDDDIFMTLLTSGTPKRKDTSTEEEAMGGMVFQNECIVVGGGFTANKNYYFHGLILRQNTDQVFNIKLINDNEAGEKIEQYIKTITVTKGDAIECSWVDIEFTFTPLSNFDTILFELQRDSTDYLVGKRYAVIIYEEISEINNLITSGRLTDINLEKTSELLKIGVQSHPGFLMCINGEEVRINRTGIYEIKNGLIVIPFFSVVTGAEETTSALEDAKNNVQEKRRTNPPTPYEEIPSVSLLDRSKTRTIDNFILDYLYKED